MKRLFGLVCWVLVVASVAFAQGNSRGNGRDDVPAGAGKDDHADNLPVQTGWAVITPVAAGTSTVIPNLVVFETFGLRRGPETSQAGVLPPDLTTSALLFVNSNGRLSRDTGVAIVNPGTSSVNVTLTLRDDKGVSKAGATFAVASHQQVSKLLTELFTGNAVLPVDFTGTLGVTSTGPVSIIGLRFRGINFSTLPVTNLASASALPVISSGVGGAGAVLLPQFAANGGWATQIVIVNSGASSATVRVDLFKPDGTPLTASLNNQTASSFTNISIPAGGVATLAPRDSRGDDDF